MVVRWPLVVCERDFVASCNLNLFFFLIIRFILVLLAKVIVDHAQTRGFHLTFGLQRGRSIGSNCVRPFGLPSIGCLHVFRSSYDVMAPFRFSGCARKQGFWLPTASKKEGPMVRRFRLIWVVRTRFREASVLLGFHIFAIYCGRGFIFPAVH